MTKKITMATENETPAGDNAGEGRKDTDGGNTGRPNNDRGEKKVFTTRSKYERDSRREGGERSTDGNDRREGGDRRSFGGDRPSREGRDSGERRSFGSDRSERPSYGDRRESGDRKPYGDRREGGERRSFGGDRREGGERRSFGGDRREDGAKRSFTPRREEGERKPFGSERGEGGGEKRSFGSDRREEGGERRSFGSDRAGSGYKKPYEGGRREEGERRTFGGNREESDRKPYGDRREGGERRSFGSDKREGGEGRSFGGDRREGGDRRSFGGDRPSREGRDSGERRSFGSDRSERPSYGDRRESGDRKPYGDRREGGERRSFGGDRREGGEKRTFSSDRPDRREGGDKRSFDGDKKPFVDRLGKEAGARRGRYSDSASEEGANTPNYNIRRYEDNPRIKKTNRKESDDDGTIRLNRYIANAGVCSRREADALIEAGEIKVNGQVVTEMGYKVAPSDTIQYGKQILSREKLVYVLLNKPKDFITTTEDPEGRKTVMDLVAKASKERIFPVGRLDRNTTGLLLFTNDGELAQKLTHPSNEIKKIYQVELDKPLAKEDFEKIVEGLELEDGKAQVDDLAIVGDSNKFVGIEIHIGRNRIVRRIFEHLGYDVVSLDRVQYAGLTKKDLPRGNWRYLSEKELIRLKYFV